MAAARQTGCKLKNFLAFELLRLYTQKLVSRLKDEFFAVSGVTKVQETEESNRSFPMKLKSVFPSLLPRVFKAVSLLTRDFLKPEGTLAHPVQIVETMKTP